MECGLEQMVIRGCKRRENPVLLFWPIGVVVQAGREKSRMKNEE